MDWSNRRALVGSDLRVADDTDDQLVAERPRLAQGIAVPVVHHIEAPVHVNPHRLLPPPPQNSQRGLQKSMVEAEHSSPKHDATDQTAGDESRAVEIIQMAGIRTHGGNDGKRRRFWGFTLLSLPFFLGFGESFGTKEIKIHDLSQNTKEKNEKTCV